MQTYPEPYSGGTSNLGLASEKLLMALKTKNRKALADIGNVPSTAPANFTERNNGIKTSTRERGRLTEIGLGDGVSMDESSVAIKEEEDAKGCTIVRRSLRLQIEKLELGEGTTTSIISTTAVTLRKPKGVDKKVRKKTAEKIEGRKSKRIPAGVSGRAWPPLTAERFGIVQEELAHNPVRFLPYSCAVVSWRD